MNSIILAGGKNTRMQGEDKAFLKVGGRAMISLIIEKLRRVSDRIIIVTNNPQKYKRFKAVIVRDDYPGLGPLAGIYSGLKVTDRKYNFITACDMPFPNLSVIKYMLSYFSSPFRGEGRVRGLDICVPKIGARFHPLCGIYSKACLPAIKEMLRIGRRDIKGIFPGLNCRFLSKREIQEFDEKLLCLANINTRQDLFRHHLRGGHQSVLLVGGSRLN